MNRKLLAELELLSPPGDTIREALEHYELSVERFGEFMEMSEPLVEALLSGALPLTGDIAERLEKVLHIDRQFWINRELNYRREKACL